MGCAPAVALAAIVSVAIIVGTLGRWYLADMLESTAVVATASLLAAPYGLIYDLAPVAPFMVWAIFRDRIASALAISAAVPPLPLALAGFELAKCGQRLLPVHSISKSDTVR